jgi:dTMP kinase
MFITLEGPEGGGKTLQAAALVEFFEELGYDVLLTHEPGGTAIGDQIRAILSNLENTAMNPRTETLLFLAARAQLVEQVIRSHLSAGGVVISDRYADSTRAYQGYGHKNDLEKVNHLIEFATGGLVPDLTLLLDIDVEEGLRRRAHGGGWNRLDAYELEFHQRVRAGYHQLAQDEPERWVVVDASRPVDEVQAELREVLLERLENLPRPSLKGGRRATRVTPGG